MIRLKSKRYIFLSVFNLLEQRLKLLGLDLLFNIMLFPKIVDDIPQNLVNFEARKIELVQRIDIIINPVESTIMEGDSLDFLLGYS